MDTRRRLSATADVSGGPDQPLPIVVEHSQAGVASEAQQAPDSPGVVAVVHVKRLALRLGGAANGTTAALSGKPGGVVLGGEPIFPLQMRSSHELGLTARLSIATENLRVFVRIALLPRLGPCRRSFSTLGIGFVSLLPLAPKTCLALASVPVAGAVGAMELVEGLSAPQI
jgi:hypothetical protein